MRSAPKPQQPAFFEGADDEDVHTLVIRKLKEKAGGLADKIHTGRSRNEQVSLDTRLWLRDEIDAAKAELTAFLGELLKLARKYPDAVIPGYTHLRRAQAVLWPHYLLAYFEMFARDWERLDQARARVNVMPLGSGALAGSGFPFDREAIAQDLGFAAITANSMDVSGDRDLALDFLYAASVTMLHLSRLAEDWILYSGEEWGWMELGDGVTSGSSLMPQKKNPDSLELIRGKCGRVWGSLSSLFVTMKGLPMTYNRDMQEDKEPLFDAADQLRGCLQMIRVVTETVVLRTGSAASGCGGKLGGRDRSGRSAGAQRHAVPSGAQDRRPACARKRAGGQEARRLDRGSAACHSRRSSRRRWRRCCRRSKA